MREMQRPTLHTKSSKNRFCEASLSFVHASWALLFLFISWVSITHGYQDGENFHRLEVKEDFQTNGYEKLFGLVPEMQAPDQCMQSDSKGKLQLDKPEDPDFDKYKQQRIEKATNSIHFGLDEFKSKAIQKTGEAVSGQLGSIIHRLEPDGSEYNYACSFKGAKVLSHNKEAKGAGNILNGDKDKYLRNPCSAEEKIVIIELSEETLVDSFEIANFEHYSSNLKDFELLGSLIYPTETWTTLGKCVAQNVKHVQRFMLPEPKWVRYLKFNLLSHYGTEFYCTLSVVQVYGVDAIERMLEFFIPKPDEESSNQLPGSNPLEVLPIGLELGSGNNNEMTHLFDGVDPSVKEASANQGDNDDGLVLDVKNEVSKGNVPDPIKEIRQQQSGRIPGDTVIKILMQKIRLLELNLSVLEGYMEEQNRRYGKLFSDLDKDTSRVSLHLEQMRMEIKDLLLWKEVVERDVGELISWKFIISSQMEGLIKDNGLLRLEVEKATSDQKIMENKELAIFAVSSIFGCAVFLKLFLDQSLMLFGFGKPEKRSHTFRPWFLTVLYSCIIALIVLL
ncbi:hypothetical protein AMTRI_Chr01g111540 [Amborella trichopoda]